MLLPSFFKRQKYKSFEYSPRYYDESKERLQERYNRIQSELDGRRNPELSGSFRENLRESWERNKKSPSPHAPSMVRMVVIALILALLFFYILS